MEPHPVPQNITSFQFKLIGDMTLKQFVYLAIGVGIAYLTFVFFGATLPAIAWPVIIISSLLGVAFAFMPVGYRSLDHWLAAFLKAVYSPTKRSWKKNKKIYGSEPLFNSRLSLYFQVASANPPTQQPTVSAPNPMSFSSMFKPALPKQEEEPKREELPSSEELQKTVELAKQAQELQKEIVENERKLNDIKMAASKPNPIPTDYSQEINSIMAKLHHLVEKASGIQNKIARLDHQEEHKPEVLPTANKVKIVSPVRPKENQLTLTSSPNVINGIIKDAENNYLDGVVVVVYDKEGLPVRALKSNKLGQFSSATPLPNGTYTIELEKEDLVFDALQMELNGAVLSPLMVSAKRAVIKN